MTRPSNLLECDRVTCGQCAHYESRQGESGMFCTGRDSSHYGHLLARCHEACGGFETAIRQESEHACCDDDPMGER